MEMNLLVYIWKHTPKRGPPHTEKKKENMPHENLVQAASHIHGRHPPEGNMHEKRVLNTTIAVARQRVGDLVTHMWGTTHGGLHVGEWVVCW